MQWDLDSYAPALAKACGFSLNFGDARIAAERFEELRENSTREIRRLHRELRETCRIVVQAAAGDHAGPLARHEARIEELYLELYRIRHVAAAMYCRFYEMPVIQAWRQDVEQAFLQTRLEMDRLLSPDQRQDVVFKAAKPPVSGLGALRLAQHGLEQALAEGEAEQVVKYGDSYAECLRLYLDQQMEQAGERSLTALRERHLVWNPAGDVFYEELLSGLRDAGYDNRRIFLDRMAQRLDVRPDEGRGVEDYREALERQAAWMGGGAPELLQRMRQGALIHLEPVSDDSPALKGGMSFPRIPVALWPEAAPLTYVRDGRDFLSLEMLLHEFAHGVADAWQGDAVRPHAQAAIGVEEMFAAFAPLMTLLQPLKRADITLRQREDAYLALRDVHIQVMMRVDQLTLEQAFYRHAIDHPGEPWTLEGLETVIRRLPLLTGNREDTLPDLIRFPFHPYGPLANWSYVLGSVTAVSAVAGWLRMPDGEAMIRPVREAVSHGETTVTDLLRAMGLDWRDAASVADGYIRDFSALVRQWNQRMPLEPAVYPSYPAMGELPWPNDGHMMGLVARTVKSLAGNQPGRPVK